MEIRNPKTIKQEISKAQLHVGKKRFVLIELSAELKKAILEGIDGDTICIECAVNGPELADGDSMMRENYG